MAIRFKGTFSVDCPAEDVYSYLTEPDRFAPLLPDYQGHETHDDGSFTVRLKIGAAQIRGTAPVTLALKEERPHEFALYRGRGKLGVGSVDIEASFQLEPLPKDQTDVHWSGQAQVFGLLNALAGGLLEPLARKNIDQLISGLKTALETEYRRRQAEKRS